MRALYAFIYIIIFAIVRKLTSVEAAIFVMGSMILANQAVAEQKAKKENDKDGWLL